MNRSFLFAATVTALLAGCGGGGGDGGTPAPPPPVSPPSAGTSPTCTGTEPVSAYAEPSAVVGRPAGAVVAGCAGPLSDVQWTQVSNGAPSVALLSATTQAISFEPPAAGTYSFSVSFRDASGVVRNANVSTVVTASPAPVAVRARVDQAVRKGGKVSLRAWPAAVAPPRDAQADRSLLRAPESPGLAGGFRLERERRNLKAET